MLMLGACQKPTNELLPQGVGAKNDAVTTVSSARTVNENITFRKGRLVFKDDSTFNQTMSSLFNIQAETFENQFSGYTSWRKHNSLITPDENNVEGNGDEPRPLYYDVDQPELPTFITTLINNKREYQIGNTIIYLEEGKVYHIPESQEATLKVQGWFKANLLGEMQKGSLKVVSFDENNGTERRKGGNSTESNSTERGWADAKYQYQYNAIGHTFKQVFEVSAIVKDNGNNQVTTIYVKQKLEYWFKRWWTRGSWQDAGDFRNVSMTNFQGYVEFPADYLSPRTSPGMIRNVPSMTSNVNGINTQREIELGKYRTDDMRAEPQFWRFNLTASQMSMVVPSHGNQSMNLSNVFWRKLQ